MDSREKFELLAAAAKADGTIQDEEKQLLHSFAGRLKLTQTVAHEIIKQVNERGPAHIKAPEDPEERAHLLSRFVEIVVADEKVTAPEMELLQRVGQAFGVSKHQLASLVNNAMRSIETAALPPDLEKEMMKEAPQRRRGSSRRVRAPATRAPSPSGRAVRSSDRHPGQYEFSDAENIVIADLAKKMTFVGVFGVVLGALILLLGIFMVLQGWGSGTGPLIGVIGVFVVAALLIVIGLFTQTAATEFHAIVKTSKRDISHLMKGMGDLNRLFKVQYYAAIATIGFVVLGILAFFLTLTGIL